MKGARLGPVSVLLFLGASLPLSALRPIAPAEAPRADASVLRAINGGAEEVNVIIGVRDGTPSARSLAAHPDPAGEPSRRLRRLAAQDAVARDFPATLRVLRRYENFSILAGRATRDGIVGLANRADVDWITVDGVRKMHEASSTAQKAQTLIHSDQANALGFTGAGQSIAILDTGVDYTVSELGGGAFPNAKVVAGQDFGDDDPDPMDCEGHGTSVAAVAAGPTGVAPDATIVALKVVKGVSCDEANDSDILAAVNWAITNQATYSISTINLSFGGAPTDGLAHGYCDDLYPDYVAAIDSANAAGIVFVASSGNDALTDAIAAPACVSNAVSVGAVYPDSFVHVGWKDDAGGTLCEDTSVTPDTIVCFSNSASNLSLLAPGAFWLVVTKGGATDFFHGTSASAPAASGAAALMHQAHPELTPKGIASLLETTGRTLVDSRNGIATPRIDTLAGAQLTGGGFAPYVGDAVPVPDGTGSATATATITGFAGTLASVEAVVEIAHADPTQLLVTLTGPDGTTVTLHDHTGAAQHPINGIYGKTLASAQSLGAFQGKLADGVWTLSVADDRPGTAGSIRTFAMRMVAGQPSASIPPAADTEVVPIVGRVQGTHFFLSDVRIFNPRPTDQELSLYYVAQGLAGSQAVRATETVPAGRVLALDDVVGSEFGYAESIGELTILGADTSFLVTSRAYTQGGNGTFGQFVPGFSSADALGFGEAATANGLLKNGQFHTNAGFTEVSGSPVSVKMDLRDAGGALLATTTRSAPANGTVLVTDIAGDRGLGATANFRVDYSVVSPSGRVAPFATFVDDTTGDGVFEPAERGTLSSDDLVVAQASHASGANGTFFRTNLHVTNLGATAATITVSLLPRVLTGTPAAPRVYVIAPGETLEKLDVLASEFGLGDPSAAGLRIHPSGAARLAVSTRTYVEKFGGTFGFSIPGLAASQAIGAGNGKAAVIQLDQTTAAQGFRSNFGFAEVGGADALVGVTAKSGDTGELLGARQFPVPANGSFQANLDQIVGDGAFTNVYLEFTVDSGTGRVLPYGVSVDNTSGDAIYMPAQREP
ncbi:MAG TPA: S8 family serine peptidase [Thermoanaerobaculia bacterium]|jgi:subtilisin-like proprotein convertase family protein